MPLLTQAKIVYEAVMAKGRKTGGGSRKGCPNKATKALKDMILQALDEVGGVDYLKRQAEKNPASFMTLIGKVLPQDVKTEISGKDGRPRTLEELVMASMKLVEGQRVDERENGSDMPRAVPALTATRYSH